MGTVALAGGGRRVCHGAPATSAPVDHASRTGWGGRCVCHGAPATTWASGRGPRRGWGRTARPPRRSAPGQAGRAVRAAAPNAWSRRPRPTVGHRGCDYCFWLDTLVPIHAPREDEMKNFYKNWLEQQGYAPGTVQTQMHRAGRVEECYGNLDEHYDSDQLRRVIDELNYSTDDERKNKPNPSKIPFNGNTRNNLATYRNAVERYCKFRRETQDEDNGSPQGGAGLNESAADRGQLIGLERDLQAALRRAIEQLEPGLEVIDDGAERSVASGFIDITAKDARGAIVVVELKTGTARQGAVAQVLSYMGDIADEEPDLAVRGILVAGLRGRPFTSEIWCEGLAVIPDAFRDLLSDSGRNQKQHRKILAPASEIPSFYHVNQ